MQSRLSEKFANTVFSPYHENIRKQVLHAIEDFDNLGTKVGKGKRNMVKHIVVDNVHLNVKSFKVPNLFNRFIYHSVRKSKARRSYEYAHFLLQQNIGTPPPVAYFEQKKALLLGKSFYVSLHIREDLTLRTLIDHPGYADREEIVRQFTRFTYRLHEKGILFLDHSPGNTLIIKQKTGEYSFFLVDLNRMKLNRSMGFQTRMKNFARLSATEDMLKLMSEEYALLTNIDQEQIFRTMRLYTLKHQRRRKRKKKISNQLGKYKQ
ncbi:MAG: Kdo domain containing protein [Bacteroidia bacterium]|nr:MAG: Kdo domain containing protein [Bacteroidia bacterium]